MATVSKDSNIKILREFFSDLDLQEMKELSVDERQELADAIRDLDADERGFNLA